MRTKSTNDMNTNDCNICIAVPTDPIINDIHCSKYGTNP